MGRAERLRPTVEPVSQLPAHQCPSVLIDRPHGASRSAPYVKWWKGDEHPGAMYVKEGAMHARPIGNVARTACFHFSSRT